MVRTLARFKFSELVVNFRMAFLRYKDGQPVTTNKDQVNSHRIILDTGALFLLKVSSGEFFYDFLKRFVAGSFYVIQWLYGRLGISGADRVTSYIY